MQYESSKEETRQEDATQIRDIVPPRSFEYNIQYQEKHLPHTTFYSKKQNSESYFSQLPQSKQETINIALFFVLENFST